MSSVLQTVRYNFLDDTSDLIKTLKILLLPYYLSYVLSTTNGIPVYTNDSTVGSVTYVSLAWGGRDVTASHTLTYYTQDPVNLNVFYGFELNGTLSSNTVISCLLNQTNSYSLVGVGIKLWYAIWLQSSSQAQQLSKQDVH